MVGDKEADEEKEFGKDFLQCVEITENLLVSGKLSDTEIMELYPRLFKFRVNQLMKMKIPM